MFFRSVISVLFFVILITPGLPAQETKFAVTSFIPERFIDTEWRLDGDFSLRGNEQSSDDKYCEDCIRKYEMENNNQNLSLGTRVRHNYVTVPAYWETSSSLNAGIYHSDRSSDRTYLPGDPIENDEYEQRESNYGRYSITFSNQSEAGKYIFSDFFLSGLGTVYFQYSDEPNSDRITNSRYESPQGNLMEVDFRRISSQSDGYNRWFLTNLEILPGFGRVYDGRFASTAMYIIEELTSAGLIQREPTYDEMLDLTEIVYQYRQKYIIDRRLHRIEALTKIVQYLDSTGVLSTSFPNAQYLIQDVWDYFPQKERRFGFRFQFGAGHAYSYRKDKTLTERDENTGLYRYMLDQPHEHDTLISNNINTQIHYYRRYATSSGYLTIRADYYRPLSRKWQLNSHLQYRLHFDPISKIERLTDNYGPSPYSTLLVEKIKSADYYNIQLDAEATYWMDSRTSIRLTCSADYLHSNEEDTDFDHIVKERDFYGMLGTSVVYRISIPTTLRANVSLNYESRYTFDQWSYNISMDVSHYIL